MTFTSSPVAIKRYLNGSMGGFGPMCQLGLDIADAVRELRKEIK